MHSYVLRAAASVPGPTRRLVVWGTMVVAAVAAITVAAAAKDTPAAVAESVVGVTHQAEGFSIMTQDAGRELLRWSDLVDLGSSPEKVMQYFEKEYGKKPDGVAVNDQGYAGSVNPPITQRYGRPAYKNMGTPIYVKGAVSDKTVDIVVDEVINTQDREVELAVKLGGSWKDEASVSWSTTSGLTMTASVSFADVFSIGSEVSLQTTIGESKTMSQTRSKETTVKATVPPRSKVVVKMVGEVSSQDLFFTVPMEASGYFGANFGRRVKDHFFWFAPVSKVLPRTTGEAKGKLRGQRVVKTRAVVGRPTSLVG